MGYRKRTKAKTIRYRVHLQPLGRLRQTTGLQSGQSCATFATKEEAIRWGERATADRPLREWISFEVREEQAP